MIPYVMPLQSSRVFISLRPKNIVVVSSPWVRIRRQFTGSGLRCRQYRFDVGHDTRRTGGEPGHEPFGRIHCSPHSILSRLEPGRAAAQTRALLEALEERLGQTEGVVTMPNSDSGGDTVASLITAWAQRHPGCVKAVASLGRARYYSALGIAWQWLVIHRAGLQRLRRWECRRLTSAIVQRGRAQGATIVNCEATRGDISAGLDMVMSREMRDRCRRNPDNPYAFHGTLEAIMKVLLSTPLPLPAFKPFYDVAW